MLSGIGDRLGRVRKLRVVHGREGWDEDGKGWRRWEVE